VKVELLKDRETFHVEIPADENNLGQVRDFIEDICFRAGFSKRDANNTKLAVDEACTNIIKHAYKGLGGTIRLDVQAEPGKVEINIFDRGESFDWSKVKDPDLDYYVEIGKKGGLGIFLMSKLMDELSYQPSPHGNRLYMSKVVGEAGRRGPLFISARPRWTETLRFKFAFRASLGLLALVLLLWGILFVRQTRTINEQLAQVWLQKKTIAENIASASKQAILDENLFSVQKTRLNEIISKQIKKYPDVKYIRVVDADGMIVSSTKLEEFAQKYVPPQGLESIPPSGTFISIEEKGLGRIRELHQPVYISAEGKNEANAIGRVVLGISEDMVMSSVNDPRPMTALLLFGIFLAGIALLYLLVSIFVKPIQALTEGVRAIGEGSLDDEIKIDGPEEIGEIARAFNEITAKFKEAQKNVVEQERLQKEMQVAQEIQHSLLPKKVPEISGYDIASFYKAAKEVGGDYYDFVHVDEDTIGVVVADVSGKGVPGSLVMTMIRTALRMEARGNYSAAEVMARMNDFVTEDMKKGMFVTIFYAILDSKNRIISYASAGHNPMILYRAETDETYFLNPRGFPVGISLPDDSLFRRSIDVEKIKLKKDDMLVIYTDGVTEAMNEAREQYGEERLIKIIKECGRKSPQEFIDRLSEDIKAFTGDMPQNDDITVVAIKEKLMADEVLFGIRKKLIDLVEVEGLSVAEACRRMKVSPSTYYRYKKRLQEMGERGLQNKTLRSDYDMKRVSIEQRKELLEIIRKYPRYGAKRIAEVYNAGKKEEDKLTPRMVYDELRRMRLNTYEKRLEYLRRNRWITEEEFKEMLATPRKQRKAAKPVEEEVPEVFEVEKEGVEEVEVTGEELITGETGGIEEGLVASSAQETVVPEEGTKEARPRFFAASEAIELGNGVVVETQEIEDEIILFRVKGHLDSSSVQDLEGVLESVYEYGFRKIVVDLSDVSYISSGGWGIFTGRVKSLREGEGDVVLVGMSAEVYDIYELLGFQEIIMHFISLDEALEYIKLPFEERMRKLEEYSERALKPSEIEAQEEVASLEGIEDFAGEEEGVWTPLRIEAGTVGEKGEITILYLAGVIDTVSSMKLKSVIDSLIDKGNIKIVVDMSKVEYVSSSGWGVFSSRIKEIRQKGGDIKIFGMDQEVDAVFHMLGFDDIMRSFSVLMEAIEDFSKPPETMLKEKKPQGQEVIVEEKREEEDVITEFPNLTVNLEEKRVNGNFALIMDADGTIDSSTSFKFEEQLEIARRKKPALLVVDLSDIIYMSSSGWGVIVKSMMEMEKLKSRMVVAGMSSAIFKIFKDLGFEPLIPHYLSVEDALNRFAGGNLGFPSAVEEEKGKPYVGKKEIDEGDVSLEEHPQIEKVDFGIEDKEVIKESDEVLDVEEGEIDLSLRKDIRSDADKRVRKLGWKEYGKRLLRRNLKEDSREDNK